MGKKKILHVIPHAGLGGAQRVFSQLYELLSTRYDVENLTFNNEYKEIYNPNMNYSYLDVRGGKSFLSKLVNFILRIRRLNYFKNLKQPFVTISHLEGADFINVLTGKHDRKIIVLHGSKVADVKYGKLYQLFRHYIFNPLVIKRADSIVCVSKGICEEVIRVYKSDPRKTTVIYNFFDLGKIRKLASQGLSTSELESVFKENFTIINSARLDVQKNQKALIDIYKDFSQNSKKKVKLIFLGDGPIREELIQYSRKLGFNTYSFWAENTSPSNDFDIFFMGSVANPFSFIGKSSLFVFTSNWEGFPLALGEAMACGTPVISSDCPTGPRELLSNIYDFSYSISNTEFAEYGVLMPMLKESDLNYQERIVIWRSAIEKLLEDPSLLEEYSNKAKKRMDRFSREKIAQDWIRLIDG